MISRLFEKAALILSFFCQIDIEGGELTVLPQLLETGALNNVNQLAMELHLTELHQGPR